MDLINRMNETGMIPTYVTEEICGEPYLLTNVATNITTKETNCTSITKLGEISIQDIYAQGFNNGQLQLTQGIWENNEIPRLIQQNGEIGIEIVSFTELYNAMRQSEQ